MRKKQSFSKLETKLHLFLSVLSIPQCVSSSFDQILFEHSSFSWPRENPSRWDWGAPAGVLWGSVSFVSCVQAAPCRQHWGSGMESVCCDRGAWWAAVHGVTKSQTWLSDFTFTFHFHALEEEMATHSSDLAWRIPGTGKPGGLPSMGLHRVGHDWSDLAAAAELTYNAVLVSGIQRSDSVIQIYCVLYMVFRAHVCYIWCSVHMYVTLYI